MHDDSRAPLAFESALSALLDLCQLRLTGTR